MGSSQVIGFALRDWGKKNLVIVWVLESDVYPGSPVEHRLGERRDRGDWGETSQEAHPREG